MQFYTEFTGITPEGLIEEAEEEQTGVSSVLMRKRKINDRIFDFRYWLEAKGHPERLDEYKKLIESKYYWPESKDGLKSEDWLNSNCLTPMSLHHFCVFHPLVYKPVNTR